MWYIFPQLSSLYNDSQLKYKICSNWAHNASIAHGSSQDTSMSLDPRSGGADTRIPKQAQINVF